MRTDVFRSLTNSAQFAGIFADSNVGRAVSAAGRGRDSVDFASRSLGSPNPFLAPRPKLHVKIRDDRLGSNRQTEAARRLFQGAKKIEPPQQRKDRA
jgi:hypothetical protein